MASRLGVPYTWVKHHVDAKAGRVCPRCDGAGDYKGMGDCFRCKGDGGTSRGQVEDALQWVEANASKVEALGERRDQNRRIRRDEAVAKWKQDHPRHWWALRNMEPSDFKSYLMRCLDDVHKGRLKPHMGRLLEIAEEVEARFRGQISPAPGKGTRIDVPVSIRCLVKNPFVDGPFSDSTAIIEFDTDAGWAGRVETRDLVIIARVEHRQDDYPHLRGVVRWSRGAEARIGEADFYWPPPPKIEPDGAGDSGGGLQSAPRGVDEGV